MEEEEEKVMWPYLCLIFFILILQIRNRTKSADSVFFGFGVLLLFWFAALRGNGSGDYFTYLERATYVNTIQDVLNNNVHMEIGFRMLSYLVNMLRLPAQFVIMAMNLISIACMTKFIRTYSPDKCLSLLLFLPLYFQFDMHAARTACAISISALGITYAYQRRFLRFCITIFMASLFHQTAVIVFVVYLLVDMDINLIVGLGGILGAMVFVKVIGTDRIILRLLRSFWETGALRYSGYVNSERYGYPFSLLDPRLWLMILIFIAAKLFCRDAGKKEKMFINCCYANIVCMIIFSEHTFICYRLSAFFNVYSVILVPMITERFCNKRYYDDINVYRRNSALVKGGAVLLFTVYALAYVVGAVEYKLCFL